MESTFDRALLLPDKPHRIMRSQYDRMVDAGVFDEQKLELLWGVIVEMSPQGNAHSFVIRHLTNLLVPLVAGKALVQVQSPLGVSDDSEPEPDLCILAPGDYMDDHPSSAFLIVEVAVSSLDKDKKLKASLYAATGQPEYWVIDVPNRAVIVHRQPLVGQYAQVTSHTGDEVLSLLQLPDVSVAVKDCLPPLK